jgi:hypothetical protein
MRLPLSRLAVPLLPVLLLIGCGGNPDARKTDGEAAQSAKAVADVDGAMADAGAAAISAPAAPPAATK